MDITGLEQRAIDFARRGDFGADAKQVNEELTKLAPSNQGAWTRLARCNIELGLLDAANEALETVLQLNPQNTIARSLLQESIRRQIRLQPEEPRPKRTASPRPRAAAKSAKTSAAARNGGAFGRAQFAALGQLAPRSALESVGPSMEALLMALNDRPFAAKVVEARNRAGRSGNRLFRRNTMAAGPPGRLAAWHYGGRWEPQLHLAAFAAAQWGRSSFAAGIGFDFTIDEPRERQDEREALLASFERFQQLVSSSWKGLLTDWMATNGGFIRIGDDRPATEQLPADAVAWLVGVTDPRSHQRIFVGRWLFADRADHAEILEDGAGLIKWTERAFVDLLPLWMSIYRNA